MSTATDTRAEWLEWRRSGIGASDIAALLGISPWASPFSVWVDKLGLLPDEELDDDDVREFGRRAEAMVGPWFRDRTGLELAGEQMWLTAMGDPWMLATPDALVQDRAILYDGARDPIDSILGPLEIKTTMDRPWTEIPAYYQAQGQWQMAVGGWERMWFAVLHGRRFRTYELERDQADIDLMTERARAFWNDHVLAKVPPPIDSSDATERALKVLYPEAEPGKVADLGADGVAWLRNLSLAKESAKLAAGEVDLWSNHLREAMADAEVGVIDGRQALTLRTQTRKTTCPDCGAVRESAPFRVLRPSKEYA